MKNKMNQCCCEEVEPTSECTICAAGIHGKPPCTYDNVDQYIRILSMAHPDMDKPGFVSQGKVTGEFNLGNEEAEFWVLFDYDDTGNYYAVVIKQSIFEEEILLRIIRVVGGVETELASRLIWVERDVNLWTGNFCISWIPGSIEVSVEFPAGKGGTLTAIKGTDNFSGFVGTMILGQASGSIRSYHRGPGEVTDEGTCADCPSLEPGEPCTCCPDNIAPTWLVSTDDFNLSNGDMRRCNTLNDQTFVLDRINVPCAAQYSQLILNSACFGGFHTRLTILLTVFNIGTRSCRMRVTITLDPITPAADPPGPCGFTSVLTTYEKTVEDGVNALCSGSHTLTKTNEDLGIDKRCNGSLPETIHVESF